MKRSIIQSRVEQYASGLLRQPGIAEFPGSLLCPRRMWGASLGQGNIQLATARVAGPDMPRARLQISCFPAEKKVQPNSVLWLLLSPSPKPSPLHIIANLPAAPFHGDFVAHGVVPPCGCCHDQSLHEALDFAKRVKAYQTRMPWMPQLFTHASWHQSAPKSDNDGKRPKRNSIFECFQRVLCLITRLRKKNPNIHLNILHARSPCTLMSKKALRKLAKGPVPEKVLQAKFLGPPSGHQLGTMFSRAGSEFCRPTAGKDYKDSPSR